MTGLVGVSGAGKTTALHCLGLLVSPTTGTVSVAGENTAGWTDKRRRKFWRNDAAFIFQDYGLIDDESVEYNVEIGQTFGRLQKSRNDTVKAALSEVGLTGRESEMVSRLSGGEKQRVGLARAIAKNAGCIFADEPTASLDLENRTLVIKVLADRARQGATVVLATHDDQAMDACDQLFILQPPTHINAHNKNQDAAVKHGSTVS